jgi:hypothetical protein
VWNSQASTTVGNIVGPVLPRNQTGAQNGVPACYQVKLPIPIIFPPLINVNITAKCGNAFTLLAGTTTNVVIRATLGGFLMTMPV